MNRGCMIQYVGHSQIQWDLRKRCKTIFELLWETNQLKSSYDAFCFMNGQLKQEPEPMVDFLHADQGGLRDYFWCYQGFVCLTDNGPGEGGFVVVPDSHLLHAQHIKSKGKREMNMTWYMCD